MPGETISKLVSGKRTLLYRIQKHKIFFTFWKRADQRSARAEVLKNCSPNGQNNSWIFSPLPATFTSDKTKKSTQHLIITYFRATLILRIWNRNISRDLNDLKFRDFDESPFFEVILKISRIEYTAGARFLNFLYSTITEKKRSRQLAEVFNNVIN